MESENLLDEEKELLLALLLEEEGLDVAEEQMIPERTGAGDVVLSFTQQQQWLLDQLAPGDPAYVMPLAVSLHGKLHLAALQRSLDEIVRRHETLRTTFVIVDGNPVQRIHPALPVVPILVDLMALPEPLRETHAHHLARDEGLIPFDLEHGPLLRVHLLRLSDREHWLLLSMHHIISDRWSLGVLLHELSVLYTAFSTNQLSPLPRLPLQYADYTLWQRERLQGEMLQTQLSYWQQQLRGAPEVLEFPMNRARPDVLTSHGARQFFTLPPALVDELNQLSRRAQITLFMTLLAAWQILLSRYSGQDDLLVGTPVANRTNQQLEGLIGYFVNTLVLRGDLSGDPRFLDLLERVRQVCLDAYAHQDIPFEQVVNALRPQRDLRHTPLFQVMFVLQNVPMQEAELPDVCLLPLAIDRPTARFELTLTLNETKQGLLAMLEYNTDLFASGPIERMAHHYQTLLEAIVADPQQPLSRLSLLTAAEQQHILALNHDEYPLPEAALCLHERFEEQVRLTPDAIALSMHNEQLSYRELNGRANRLAHRLQQLGIEPDTRVGLGMERSLDMAIGLLAILKAGGAYVPLDPDAPPERLAFILADAQVSLVLTQPQLLAQWTHLPVQLLCVEDDPEQEEDNPTSGVTVRHLAYVIYTSGSTGQPKGVMIPHSNVLHLFDSTDALFHFTVNDVWTLFHSIAFDFSVWELWGALLTGGRLVLVPYWISRSPQTFWELLQEQQVTVLNQTPSAFRSLLAAEDPDQPHALADLRLIIFGGEALDLASLAVWWQRHSDQHTRLVNMYGITETTVHVTAQHLDRGDPRLQRHNLIGRPRATMQLYVLDEALRPVPPGITGELYVGGPGLARGYLANAALTAERFLPHPWSSQPGSRLYKTGDLARLLENGDVEYVGRNDAQVKLRGFRIELGEIEAALATHHAVRDGVVLLQSEGSDQRLVAYLIAHGQQRPDASELRRYLQTRLPDYMVPTFFLWLDALPLTSQGKLDYRALPQPGSTRPDLDERYAPPRTPTEEILVGIWSQVLKLEQVGIHDNFFALGGDSIRSIQVLALARERKLGCSIQQLFQYQTIALLSEALAQQSMQLAPLPEHLPFSLLTEQDRQKMPTDVQDAYPLSMLQAGMFFHSDYSPETAVYHDIFCLRLEARLDEGALCEALRQIVARHPILRTSFDLTTFSRPLQLVHTTCELPLSIEDWSHFTSIEQDEQIVAWMEAEKGRRIDWSQAPLLRMLVARRSEETFELVVSFHHAILDGWSVASLFSELFQRYLSILEASEMPETLPPAALYRDFVALEQHSLTSVEAKQYWAGRLHEHSSTVVARWPRRSREQRTTQAHSQRVVLPRSLSDGLTRLARMASVPLKSVLLAAHVRVMGLLSGESDILTGLVANGRPEALDGERVLGLFLNTLPHRQTLGGGNWLDLIRETFAVEQEALPFRRYPLAQIQQDSGGQALFETAFNFVHFHVYEGVLELKNLRVLGGSSFERTNFTLVANFNQAPDSQLIQLRLEANAAVLPEEQVEAIISYYTNTLAAMVQAPTAAYRQQSLLSAEEERRLLIEWNDTRALVAPAQRFTQLFEEQAVRTPDAIALVVGEEHLSYQEVNQRANQLARRLRAIGVGVESLVGVCLERGSAMLVGLLAILKAGGAYVPLDPTTPWERIAFVQTDTRMRVLLTQEQLLHDRTLPDTQVLLFEREWAEIARQRSENLEDGAAAENLAYVIYTSGSTGQPKGVQIEQRALLNFLSSMRDLLGVGSQDRWLALTPISFDIAALELFLPLTVGATVVLASRETLADGAALVSSIRETGTTIAQATPATWRLFAQVESDRPVFPLTILCGGEAFPRELLAPLQERATRVWNLYGPTETTIWSSIRAMQAESETGAIGRPIANTQLYVLDTHLLPVPVGVAGELHIGGQGIARGYLRRPDLTAERFIPNPFEPGTRLYKTGDWVRYHPDSTLEFLGRQDQQIKLRGYRIELGEIEAVLLEQPGVREAVVVVHEAGPEDRRLVAYVVASESPEPTAQALRRALAARLPDYMLPSTFQWLSAFPLTPHGKLDRRALPAPDGGRAEQAEGSVAARTPLEELLVGVWKQVLRLERVSVTDDFFALGGHSLLATQVIARIRELVQVEVPLRALFEAPSVAALAKRITHLAQEALLPPLLPTSYQGDVPLSFAQERLWFLEQFEPDHALYNLPGAVSLRGVLNIAALECSLNEIVQRHAVLRTTFPVVDGVPVQRIEPTLRVRVPVIDLETIPEQQRETLIQMLMQQEAGRAFDLEHGPLLRVWVLRVNSSEHVLLMNLHHIVADGWSLGVFIRDLSTLYVSFSISQPSQLPALPIQYADYTLWQRQWLAGEVMQTQLSYWRRQLQALPVLDLPTDHVRPSRQTFRGAAYSFDLPATLSADLQVCSQQEGVTLFMSLLAGWMICLSRFSGQDDLAVGTPIANRRQSETEALIGCFINTLVLRADLSGNPTLRTVLKRMREVTLQAYAHQDIPFEQLVEAMASERDLSRSPLFQVLFAFQNTPRENFELPGLTLQALERKTTTARFDLTLTLAETAHGLKGRLEYNTDLFEVSTIARIINTYLHILSALVSNPQRLLSHVPLLTTEERQQMLYDWNATQTDVAWDRSMLQLFAEQVAQTPDAIALVCAEEQLTYQTLDQWANRLAHVLRQRGIGPEMLVGVYLPRSCDLVVALLAIFKAGGAYVPLDPAYPPERLALLMSDARLSLIVTQQDLLVALPNTTSPVLSLDHEWSGIEKLPDALLPLSDSAEHLAYVIYTSGSTGRPKGVMVAHRQLTNFFAGMDRLIGSEEAGTWLAVTSISFDIAGLELLWTLLRGYRVVIYAGSQPNESNLSPWHEETVLACMQQEQATHFQCTPSLLRMLLLEDGAEKALGQLQTVLVGGEALPFLLASQVRELIGGQLLNMYGPTETTIWSTSQRLLPEQQSVTIGRPLVNTQAYVLDVYGQPVPPGAVGEVFLGGSGVSRGYLDHPDLTAERFLPDPFSSEPGSRLYRTGDRARYLPNGELEYVGRTDQQVKIRGVRIELGEIEAVLSQHPNVSVCAVAVHEMAPGDQRLVAYVVARQETLVGDLRRYLETRLPAALFPSTFLLLPELPLTPNGKLDRRALPAPDARFQAESYIAPRTPLEEVLVKLWAEVLRVERVGVQDSFFELGGHSLLATQVIARLRTLLQVELPLRTLFEQPTVEGLARLIQAQEQQEVALSVPPLEAFPRGRQAPLSFAQERLWFLAQLEPDVAIYTLPVSFMLQGPLHVPALEQSLQALYQRHEILRTHLEAGQGQPMQVIGEHTTLNVPLIDLSRLSDKQRTEQINALIQAEIGRPFVLSQGPLLHVALLRLESERHVLLFNVHHSIFDGWSLGVFCRELSLLYAANCAGEEASLPALPVQYADYALWQRSWLQGAVLERQLNYWSHQLANLPILQLPTDHPHPVERLYRGGLVRFEIPVSVSQQLKAFSQREGVTLFMSLLAGFELLLSRYSGQEDFAIGTPIANRTRQEMEGLLGFFANTLVLRTDVAGNPSIRELLARIRQRTLGAYEHQDVPFEKVVEALNPQRRLEHNPLFQVLFALQNAPHSPLDLAGIEVQPQEMEATTSRFDLALTLAESGEMIPGGIEYDVDLFEEETIERLSRHYVQLLTEMVQQPERHIGDLMVLTNEEQYTLLVERNATEQAFTDDLCLHELFERQAARTPDAVAVEVGDEQLTFAALDRRAEDLAIYLQGLGVGPEVLVGLCVERTLEVLIGILGVLKAGGAYVPLDAAFPQERLDFMLHDSQVQVLLTQQSLLAHLPAYQGQVLCLDQPLPLAGQKRSERERRVRPENLAYVIYTSGSTGRPKGVCILHGAVVNLLESMQRELGLTAADRLLSVAALSFDMVIPDLLLPFVVGNRLILLPQAEIGDGEQIAHRLSRAGVTIMQTVPSLWQLLLAADWPYASYLKIITGGEALPRPLADQLIERAAAVWNFYGPTETTVWSSQARLEEGSPVGVGLPLANTQVYVLDRWLQPVPVGVVGEIYIGGSGLARGYLGRAELTAERFVPDAWSKEPGARLYRTGDLARYRADGTLEVVGRADSQIKLRGFRIELGEIESVLQQHPGIQECMVVLREERLIAYLVGEQEQLTIGEVRAWTGERLPAYMQPAAFVLLEQLPHLPNGKIDRRALPAPESMQTEPRESYLAPRTPLEEVLANLWADVLSVEQVGAQDNFFELGGHSLLATQIIARLRTLLQVELPLRALFEQPTVEGLARLVLQARASEQEAVPPLEAPPRGDMIPLSFAQERLWFLGQLEPDVAIYSIPAALLLHGPLNAPALVQSLQTLYQRHEVLRTHFAWEQDQPVQIISKQTTLRVPFIDLSGLADEQQSAHVSLLSRTEAQSPFSLEHGPLLRVALVRLGNERHVLLLNMHHSIFDGWSLGVFCRELSTLYAANCVGEAARLPVLPIQYADYALWQRLWLQGSVLEQQLRYWSHQLANLPTLQLPTDHPRSATRRYRGGLLRFQLSARVSQQLKAFSQREGVTLFMSLLAGFELLLSRYSGQEDFAIGTPIANRTRQELEGLLGYFANTLVLRADVVGNPQVRELLARIRQRTLGAYEHQDVPFEKVVEALNPQRRLEHDPLFQVFFALQNAPRSPLQLIGVEIQQLETGYHASRFDLTLTLTEGPHGLLGGMEYDADLFEDETIQQLSRHYVQLLEQMIQQPEGRIAELPLLTRTEQEQLGFWHVTENSYPHTLSVHEFVEQQAERRPDAIALVFEDQQCSYSELNTRANQLAHLLRRLGVGPETSVGICLERSIELVIGILGILKAGGGYVPLDPGYPGERLDFMLADSRAAVLLTQHSLAERLSIQHPKMLYLESAMLMEQRDDNLHVTLHPDNLAYIIYTSGSTGAPKGVMVTHANAARLFAATEPLFHFSARDVWTLFHSAAFDFSVWELWGALLYGGRLAIVPYWVSRSPQAFATLLAREQVTVLNQTPSAFRQLLSEEHLDQLPAVRLIIFGGEALDLASVQLWWRRYPHHRAELVNMYGITETTVHVTAYILSSDDTGRYMVIGRSLPDLQLYVLDAHLQPVPPGVAGELYVGGAGLARGYLGRADLTAERFVPHPWSLVPGSRLYKTGDVVRLLRDGTLAYVGRNDEQVKIRGFRIELGEIEAALLAVPAIQKAVVTVQQSGPGDQRLVAYVVSSQQQPSQQQLRDFLAARLPDYMLPSLIVWMEDLPLSPNGKVNRRALPMPESVQTEARENYLDARSPLEEMLVNIWADILHIERVGVRDNFFELGGHSLLATQVMARLRTLLQVELPLRTLFEQPTVEGLAQLIQIQEQQASSVVVPPLEASPRGDVIPLSFAQERLWFLAQLGPEATIYSIPVALLLHGSLNVPALAQSLQALYQRHEILRTRFAWEQGQPVQIISDSLTLTLPIIDLSGLADEQQTAHISLLSRTEAERPFSLEHGPLLRVALVRLGNERHVLLLNVHHSIFDGWSLGVFCRELSTLYAANCVGEAARLPVLPMQYADYALWQRSWLQGIALEQQLHYWSHQLANLPILQLPTDHPRSTTRHHRGGLVRFQLSSSLSQQLEAFSQREGVTLFMSLMAGFEMLLARYSGQEDFAIGTTIANRTRHELEGLLGSFINTLVLHADVAGNPLIRELLTRIRQRTLGAYEHQDVPFEKVVEALNPQRRLEHDPLFQVFFILQNTPRSPLQLPGIEVQQLEIAHRTSRFDLTLTLAESHDGLLGSMEYDADLFEEETIERLSRHYIQLLAEMVQQPEQRIGDLMLLTVEEHHALLVERNATAQAFTEHLCLHELFERQAARTPDAVAVEVGDELLTFAELDRRAEDLSDYLQGLGVGPEVLVGLCVERTLEALIGILGVLKAGGAYVPLDPTYPQERLGFMLHDSQARVLLTQQRLLSHLPAFTGQVLCLDQPLPGLERSERKRRVKPDNLAYVIYTSGSTGRAKGVGILHSAVVNLQESMQRELALTAADRLLAVTTLSFDIAALELLLPLLNGARLVLLPQSEMGDGKRIVQRMEKTGITILQTVPSLWQLLLASDWPATLRLKAVTGGEALSDSLADQLVQRAVAAWNVYGPTETTIWSTQLRIEEGQPVSIGVPLANTQVYVLDRWLQPVPPGVVGELYIGGSGLARGYLGRADLTAERFVPDAWGQEAGARLYRTGDLARYRVDGTLEVIGRADSQIKLRGFRIELGEIESVLQQHPGVQECVVVLREERLVAYLVMQKGREEPTISELHAWMGERLPTYMQLAAFVLLERLPRLPNGKLDRRALPEPDHERPQLAGGYVAPRTEIEQQLVEIWQEVLQLERVGVQDAFFELGGHSLQLVQVQQKLEEASGISLPLLTFFQYPRIDALARYLSREEDVLQTFWQKDQLGTKLKAGKSRLGQRLAQRRQEKRR